MLSMFGTHTHTLFQLFWCLHDVFLKITHNTIVKEDRFRTALVRINKKMLDRKNVKYRNTCSNVRIASRNANTLVPREWYMLLSAQGSMIFFASSKSLLKKQWIAFFASIIAVSKSIDASLDKNFANNFATLKKA